MDSGGRPGAFLKAIWQCKHHRGREPRVFMWKTARSPPGCVQAENLAQVQLLPPSTAEMTLGYMPAGILQLPDKSKCYFPLLLGALTIKGKLNNLILVKSFILPHASIFYENIWMFYHFGKIIHKMSPEVYILYWSPGRGWGLIQSSRRCCVTNQSEIWKHPRREANHSLLFWKDCLSDHRLSSRVVWPERRRDAQAGLGAFALTVPLTGAHQSRKGWKLQRTFAPSLLRLQYWL